MKRCLYVLGVLLTLSVEAFQRPNLQDEAMQRAGEAAQRRRAARHTQPAEPTSASQSSTSTAAEQENCAVCLEDLGETPASLGCGHHFHQACIDEWLSRGGAAATCPLCRAPQLPGEEPRQRPAGQRAAPQQVPSQAENDIALIAAVRNHNYDAVRVLLDRGANPNVRIAGGSAFSQAVVSSNINMINLLLEHGADVNAGGPQGRTLLVTAVMGGNVGVLNALLGAPGINVNARDASGKTALFFAVEWGNVAAVRRLCGIEGIDVNLGYENGTTVLMVAVRSGNIQIASALLGARGINVNLHENGRGATALMLAAYWGRSEMVSLLLGVPGIEKNAIDRDGNTALIVAAMRDHSAAVNQLLKYGADTTIRNSQGETALDAAQAKGNQNIVTMLENAAADEEARRRRLRRDFFEPAPAGPSSQGEAMQRSGEEAQRRRASSRRRSPEVSAPLPGD